MAPAHPLSGSVLRVAADAALDALAVLLPVVCVGCGAPDRALCPPCRRELDRAVRPGTVELRPPPGHLPPVGAPGPSPAAALRLWHACEYDGVLARIIHSLKERGRTDAAKPLGAILSTAITAAAGDIRPRLGPGARVVLAAVPSSPESFRTRGYNPVELLLRRLPEEARRPSGRRSGGQSWLRHRRSTADQAGLGSADRWRNLSGSLQAHRAVFGRDFLIVDDVVTTGATLLECRRAITDAGGRVWGAVSVAYTRKTR